jgi:hypothetical protein
MTERQHFKATIEDAGDGGAFVRVPFNVEGVYGQKTVKIKALIDGEPYRGTLVRMGMPEHVLIILKAIREKIGKTFGDGVEVTLEEDTEPRVVQVPPDFQSALEREPAARAAFERLSYTHQKEYVRSIEEAKHAETRQKRIEKCLELLKSSAKPRRES